ncbi:MAG: hypothetical protein M1830_008916 [Pleopsidium flavum]|nr:MAG: hypothetical protein M1830_008916 [Pleopsidium flavum]
MDKIDSLDFNVTNPTPANYQSSESPCKGPLNYYLALSSSSSRSAATIFPNDFQSFITDNQQTWPSHPPSQRLTPATQPDFTQPPSADFVLFPSSTASRPARHSIELPPATSRTTPSITLRNAFPGQSRRNSTQQLSSSVASVQNPRVTRIIIQGTGHNTSSSSSHRFSSPGQKHQFYASSAPSSSSALQQQPSNRPPVPLFSSNSTGNLPRQRGIQQRSGNMSISGVHPGKSSPRCDLLLFDRKLRRVFDADVKDMLDFSDDFSDEVAHDTALFDVPYFSSPHFTTINDPTSAQTSSKHETVSPKDLMVGPTSAPPSTTFTNYTSPSIWDSPDVAESFETSPLFYSDVDLGAGTDAWPSLFPGASGESDEPAPDQTEDVPMSSPFVVTAGTSTMSRQRSSPGQSPHTSRGTQRHSSVSGVNARKRDKPLPPITVRDPSDTVELKRARNTAAARKSRQKKVEKFEELEKQIEDLQVQVEHWKSIALARTPMDTQV